VSTLLANMAPRRQWVIVPRGNGHAGREAIIG
jgi:hypothetical protein